VIRPENNKIAEGDPLTAENSRPRRAFKEEMRQDRDSRGRKRKHEATTAKLVNWKVPHLWSQIEAAAREVGSSMSPAAIVRILKQRNPKDFASLHPQVLGTYMDKPTNLNERRKWKDSVLAEVGYRPGGQSTRAGVLVRYFHRAMCCSG
jgi:hypothetical protein